MFFISLALSVAFFILKDKWEEKDSHKPHPWLD